MWPKVEIRLECKWIRMKHMHQRVSNIRNPPLETRQFPKNKIFHQWAPKVFKWRTNMFKKWWIFQNQSIKKWWIWLYLIPPILKGRLKGDWWGKNAWDDYVIKKWNENPECLMSWRLGLETSMMQVCWLFQKGLDLVFEGIFFQRAWLCAWSFDYVGLLFKIGLPQRAQSR
jgi:hypothetical protein